MNITGHRQEIVISIDQKSFIPALIKMPHPAMSTIERGSIRDIEMAHKVRKVALRGGYQDMEMVGHTNVCQKGYIIDVSGQ